MIRRLLGVCLFSLLLMGCKNDYDYNGMSDPATMKSEIAFSASVIGSQTATRADGSLVNRQEVRLPATASRTYYIYNTSTQQAEERQREYYVGIFGAFTGQQTWQEYLTDKGVEPPADLFFNQQASIEPYANGRNALSYSPLRFWSNNIVAGAINPTQREYASFWAYYPYNPTGDPGTYGIAITTDDTKPYHVNNGVGRVRFTMHPDAAEQVDFMASDIVCDRSRTSNPLVPDRDAEDNVTGYHPNPVPFSFHHLLAQVRLYAFMRAADKMVYIADGAGEALTVKSIEPGTSVTLSNDVVIPVSETPTYVNAYGKVVTLGVGDRIPDDASWLTGGLKTNKTQRWKRLSDDFTDKGGNKIFADISLSMSLNNIYTVSDFTSSYNTSTGQTEIISNVVGSPTGSATVNHYIQNPYWFLFDDDNRRVMLDDNFMYGYFEESPSNNGGDANALRYMERDDNNEKELRDRSYETEHTGHHYNYAPGNILLVVPQVLTDDDVPHIIITMKGKDARTNEELTARVTINLLKMNIKWESGFIYCYAFVDELEPGDDKVRGPENITVVFDPTRNTDQW